MKFSHRWRICIFFLIMFRLIKWTRNRAINNLMKFLIDKKIETLCEFNLIEFLNDEKICRFNYINKSNWFDLLKYVMNRYVFHQTWNQIYYTEIVDFSCRFVVSNSIVLKLFNVQTLSIVSTMRVELSLKMF